jgi:hypothetical protein
LDSLRDTLTKNTISSALTLKKILTPISLKPVLMKEGDFYQLFERDGKNFKPYYVAHTKIRTLALLDERYQNSGAPVAIKTQGQSPAGTVPVPPGSTNGANWLHWRCVYRCVRIIFQK